MAQSVKVRVAVAVGSNGDWNAAGFCEWGDKEATDIALEGLFTDSVGESVYILTAEVPVPAIVEVAAKVED